MATRKSSRTVNTSAKGATLPLAIPQAPRKALAILANVPAPDAGAVAALAGRATGSGGGYKGARHTAETVAALAAALAAAGIAPADPAALPLSMAVAAGAGFLRWILAPCEDGTLAPGKAPLAPLGFDPASIPEGAAVAIIPPCGAFPGGLEVLAPASIPASGKRKAKEGLALFRMKGGSLAPVVILAEGDTLAAVNATAEATGIPASAVALLAHLRADNQGGRMIASLAAASAAASDKAEG